MDMRSFNKKSFLQCINSVLDNIDLWLFPTVLLVAWLYYPFCQEGPNLCIWKALFNRPCFGCGLTRGVCFLVHGRLHDAIRFNPLSVFALLLMGAIFSRAFCDRWAIIVHRQVH
jgi:hypothetical protein